MLIASSSKIITSAGPSKIYNKGMSFVSLAMRSRSRIGNIIWLWTKQPVPMTLNSKHSCSVLVFRRFYDSWNHLTKTDSIRESQTDRVDINTSLLHLCQKIHKKSKPLAQYNWNCEQSKICSYTLRFFPQLQEWNTAFYGERFSQWVF